MKKTLFPVLLLAAVFSMTVHAASKETPVRFSQGQLLVSHP